MEFLLGPITQRINVLYEARMKWTWHHSKLAVEEVSFFGRLRVVLLHYYLYTIEQWTLRTWVWCSYDHVTLCLMKYVPVPFNTLRPRQNGRHFADHSFKCIFLNENVSISINISLKFDPNGLNNNIPALVQIMAWRRPGDKPLSESMVGSLLAHICVTRPQWVNFALIALTASMHSRDVFTYIRHICFTGIERIRKTVLMSVKSPWGIWVKLAHTKPQRNITK